MRISEVADTKAYVMHEGESLSEVLKTVSGTTQATFPVLDSSGALVGVISLEQIRRVVNEKLPTGLIIAADLMIGDFPFVLPSGDLAEGLRLLASVDLEEIPVWDPERRQFGGLLRRRDLTRRYVERMAQLERAED
jgi:CBS domain-containing protein